jgi:hypothetical protein
MKTKTVNYGFTELEFVIGKLFPFSSNKHSSLLRKSVNHGQKSFITLDPGDNVIKLFTSVNTKYFNKLLSEF